MENRSCQAQTPILSRSHSSKRLKFRELPPDDYNELNSKYELYKRGTPNNYAEDIAALRARNIRNDVSTTELNGVEAVLSQLAQGQPANEKQINQRNYDLYPTLLKQSKPRYKEMLSEKQEIKDFVVWFETQMQAIERSPDVFSKKFQDKQTLLAAGFSQMVAQVAKTSKNRAQILKMLWNRQSEEVGSIIDALNGQSIRKERSMLQQISKLHQEYQRQMEVLQKGNRQLEEGLNKQRAFSRTLVQTLRTHRKRIKKMEYLTKKLSESTAATKRENLNLIEQNIKLLMSIRDISEEEALILNYRRMQVHQEKDRLAHHKTKKLIQLADVADDATAPLQEVEDKKKALYDFFMQRLKDNPEEKIFIRQEYFPDEEENVVAIDQHFKNIIDRPNIKMELLTQNLPLPTHRDKGINTDSPEASSAALTITLEKGVQVHISDPSCYRDDPEGHRLYQVMSPQQDQQVEKESKRRIIQQRISRKNSLTLLQIQGLSEGIKGQKKQPRISNIAKKKEECHLQAIDSDHSESDSQSEPQILINGKDCELTAINVATSVTIQRKSKDFHNLLERLKETYEGSNSEEQNGDGRVIKLQGQLEDVKYSQLDDLIRKHLQKEHGKPVQNPEKYLNKLLIGTYKAIAVTHNYSFMLQLLDVIKNSYGNSKSMIWKFLNIVSIIHNHANTNSLLKIASLFLKVNPNYALYDELNTQEVSELYFRMFELLTLRAPAQNNFNLWKACTSLQRIKSLDFLTILEEFFGGKKRSYIENQIDEMIGVSKKGGPPTLKKIDTIDDNGQIVKLNPILLFVLEVYLIEKNTYHASYEPMLHFASKDNLISADLVAWLLDFLALQEEPQNQMLSYLLQRTQKLGSNEGRGVRSDAKGIRNDCFYRFCLKFDMPLFDEVVVAAYARFKLLPPDVQQRYFRMIGVEEWTHIRQELLASYRAHCTSEIYLKAFTLILDKLEGQIKRGASIYGEEELSSKRKEEVFAVFYKIAIIEAHRHLLEKPQRHHQTHARLSHAVRN